MNCLRRLLSGIGWGDCWMRREWRERKVVGEEVVGIVVEVLC
jgi:hypothetical protein